MSSSKTDHSPVVSEFSYVVDVSSRSPGTQAGLSLDVMALGMVKLGE